MKIWYRAILRTICQFSSRTKSTKTNNLQSKPLTHSDNIFPSASQFLVSSIDSLKSTTSSRNPASSWRLVSTTHKAFRHHQDPGLAHTRGGMGWRLWFRCFLSLSVVQNSRVSLAHIRQPAGIEASLYVDLRKSGGWWCGMFHCSSNASSFSVGEYINPTNPGLPKGIYVLPPRSKKFPGQPIATPTPLKECAELPNQVPILTSKTQPSL